MCDYRVGTSVVCSWLSLSLLSAAEDDTFAINSTQTVWLCDFLIFRRFETLVKFPFTCVTKEKIVGAYVYSSISLANISFFLVSMWKWVQQEEC